MYAQIHCFIVHCKHVFVGFMKGPAVLTPLLQTGIPLLFFAPFFILCLCACTSYVRASCSVADMTWFATFFLFLDFAFTCLFNNEVQAPWISRLGVLQRLWCGAVLEASNKVSRHWPYLFPNLSFVASWWSKTLVWVQFKMGLNNYK